VDRTIQNVNRGEQAGRPAADITFTRALGDLRETAELLRARYTPPLRIFFAIVYRLECYRRLGLDFAPDEALNIVRGLPGQAGFSPLHAWQESLADLPSDVADTIITPSQVEQKRRRRSHALAGWLYVRGETELAGAITDTAELLARQQLGEGSADVQESA
jgi:hypothetical protein